MSKEKKMSFEKSAERLEHIVKQLETGEAPLDKALELYEEGARLVKACRKMLEDAEQIVVTLQRGDDGSVQEIAFDESE